MMAGFECSLDPLSSYQLKKKKQKKKNVKVGPPLAKRSGSQHVDLSNSASKTLIASV